MCHSTSEFRHKTRKTTRTRKIREMATLNKKRLTDEEIRNIFCNSDPESEFETDSDPESDEDNLPLNLRDDEPEPDQTVDVDGSRPPESPTRDGPSIAHPREET